MEIQATTLPITLPRWRTSQSVFWLGVVSIAYELLPVFGIVEEKFSGGER
jgi:hypothetical protein